MMTEEASTVASLICDFQAHVLHGTPDIIHSVVDGPRINAKTRLAIYANAYCQRLQEVLDSDYPALHVLVGDELFEQLARAYIAAHPSVYPNARWFGATLPQFLKTREPFASHPVLAEMAGLEWAMGLAFDAADDHIVAISELASLAGETWPLLRLTLHASVQQIPMRWNVVAFWQAVDDDSALPIPAQAEDEVVWIVWRRGYKTCFRALAADEAWALSAMTGGATFATLCEGLCEWHDTDTVAIQAVTLLRQWIDSEMIGRLQISTP